MTEEVKATEVEREVLKPIKMRVKGVFKEKPVGEVIKVTPENAEIFKDRLGKPGALKTAAGRKAKFETENAELKAENEKLEAHNKALLAENQQLKAVVGNKA